MPFLTEGKRKKEEDKFERANETLTSSDVTQNIHMETRRAARLDATSHTYWTILTSSWLGMMPNFSRTSLVFLSSISTVSLKSRERQVYIYALCASSFASSGELERTYCSMYDTRSVVRVPGVRRLCGTFSPTNKSPSLVNLASITRTTSPRYLPAMYFSNLRKEVTMRRTFSRRNRESCPRSYSSTASISRVESYIYGRASLYRELACAIAVNTKFYLLVSLFLARKMQQKFARQCTKQS